MMVVPSDLSQTKGHQLGLLALGLLMRLLPDQQDQGLWKRLRSILLDQLLSKALLPDQQDQGLWKRLRSIP